MSGSGVWSFPIRTNMIAPSARPTSPDFDTQAAVGFTQTSRGSISAGSGCSASAKAPQG